MLETVFAGGCGFDMEILDVEYRRDQGGEKKQQGDEEGRIYFHADHHIFMYKNLEIINAVVIVTEGGVDKSDARYWGRGVIDIESRKQL